MTQTKILIVDDEPLHRKLIARELLPFNPKIIEASNGEEAFELLQSGQSFDLILTDIEMPKLDGFSLCEKIKNDSLFRNIPVVLISAFDSDSAIEKGFDCGADAFIIKEKAKQQFFTIVNNILSRVKYLYKRKILVVDDSVGICKIICKRLKEAGFIVACASNGKEALKILSSNSFDLILSDLVMPKMDGVALCEKIKTNKKLANIPFIVMSSTKDYNIMHLKHYGIAGFIQKPFHPNELIILIEKIFADEFFILNKEKENLENERNMMLSSITGLVNALEARDSYTQGHSESVARIVSDMAKTAGIKGEELETIEIGARLHDIGKIGIRDVILFKKQKLSANEYENIKMHPKIGGDMLKSIPSLSPILPIILHHHERFDGLGYPHGLKGNMIPLWARMTAVADAYDAMTSDRVYRKRMSSKNAKAIIKELSGVQFCPECVDFLLKIYKNN